MRDVLVFAAAMLSTIAAWYYNYLNEEDLRSITVVAYETRPELTAGHEPKLCLGYDFVSKDVTGRNEENCPPNHAYYSNVDSSVRYSSSEGGRVVELAGTCCPLPADDILTDEHVYNVLESCPYNYVATGGTGQLRDCGKSCSIRCTKINTERYRLGDEQPSRYWKMNLRHTSSGRGFAEQIKWHHIPSAIRYAMGRSSYANWELDGCVGTPFGSLLVKKRKYTCDGFYYRPLLFKDGGYVRMFPDCVAVDDPLDQSPRCLRK